MPETDARPTVAHAGHDRTVGEAKPEKRLRAVRGVWNRDWIQVATEGGERFQRDRDPFIMKFRWTLRT